MEWLKADDRIRDLECRHFFSGAAAYLDGKIVATLTLVGLAFKVPSMVHDRLIESGLAGPLRYFPNAPVKRNYVLFSPRNVVEPIVAARLILGEYPELELGIGS